MDMDEESQEVIEQSSVVPATVPVSSAGDPVVSSSKEPVSEPLETPAQPAQDAESILDTPTPESEIKPAPEYSESLPTFRPEDGSRDSDQNVGATNTEPVNSLEVSEIEVEIPKTSRTRQSVGMAGLPLSFD